MHRIKLLWRQYYLIVAKTKLKFQKKSLLKTFSNFSKFVGKSLTHFMTQVSLYTPSKHWKSKNVPIFSGRYRKKPMAWNALTRIPVLAKLHAPRPTKLLLLCPQRSPMILTNWNQIFFTLTNAHEGFTYHFSVKTFIEKLFVRPLKTSVIWLYFLSGSGRAFCSLPTSITASLI